MARPQKYSDKQILSRLREHCIDNLGSVWTMHNPSWNGITKRMDKDKEFAELVEDVVAEANHKWEKIGLKALLKGDQNFNVTLYKHFTQNKKAFLSHTELEVDERIKALEENQ